MKKRLFLLAVPAMIFFTGCDTILNPDNGNEVVVEGEITSPTTWTADKVWKINTDLNVNSDLIIEPGTVIEFGENVSMYIGYSSFASVTALGTEDDPILFTSAASNKGPGDWRGIYFYDANSSSATKFSWCTFEYGGGGYEYNGMIELNETGISMTNCTVRWSDNNGIVLSEAAEFTLFSNNTIEDCAKHCITCYANAIRTIGADNSFVADAGFGIETGGYINKTATWYKFDVPYYLNYDLSVESEVGNVEWTINPGVTIKCGPGHYIWIGYGYFAKVIASGTPEEPIVFTSAASSPSKGDWDALVLGNYTSSSSLLNYCQVLNSGGDGYGAIYITGENNNVTVSNCKIARSSSAGIYVWYAGPVLINNTFEDNNGEDIHIEAD
jgi:parallel beta-helix repeat protein